MTVPSDVEVVPPGDTVVSRYGEIVGRIAGRLTAKHADRGELAELRRLAGGKRNAAYWRVMTAAVGPTELGSDERERIWAALLAAFAVLAPLGSGRGVRLGTALARSGYSEPRILRLLRSERESVVGEIQTAARWLAAKGQAADWTEIAGFALSRLREHAGSDDWEARRLARQYFEASASKPRTETEDQ